MDSPSNPSSSKPPPEGDRPTPADAPAGTRHAAAFEDTRVELEALRAMRAPPEAHPQPRRQAEDQAQDTDPEDSGGTTVARDPDTVPPP